MSTPTSSPAVPIPPLYQKLVGLSGSSAGVVLDAFLDAITSQGLSLYPAQENAILELYERKNVILNTPTGSGKSLVAAALHFLSTAQGRRSVYTCPIKALVNEKFLALCREFGAQNVGMATGDATVNRDAPILCCTAEILANLALSQGPDTGFSEVIMDEFHYYSDRDRGVAWQVPLLTMSNARFLLMSATLGETDFFATELTRLTGAETVLIRSTDRPVPLNFEWSELTLAEKVAELVAADRAPVYLVHFTQNDAVQSAQDFMSLNLCTREQKQAIATALQGTKFTSPFGKDLQKYLRHGVGVHHAGLLPKYRILVEQLAQKGILKIICGTDTLGVGVNVPIRTVLFTRLCKFDGQKTGILTARDFHQIAGRAGRRGYDSQGWVIAQAPEHAIENKRLAQKAERDGKKNFVRRKPPEEHFVSWDEKTFERLQKASPEPLVSRFQVSHGMLLQVLGREAEDGCEAMRRLIRDCHESARAKAGHRSRAWQLFRALVDRRIIEIAPAGDTVARKLRLNVDLQEDFSLTSALSLYLLDTLKTLDPEAADHHLVVLTLVESILENPEVVLRKQLDKVKSRRMAEMKQDGASYDERMEELEKLEYPKPNREFVYSSFNAFAAAHPWVGQENIRPKSIAREMVESFRSFNDYVKDYELGRAEGVLLRHLTSVYKTLAKTVPDGAKTEALREIEVYFEALLRQVDSSLLEEWERMNNPGAEILDGKAESDVADAAALLARRRAMDITSDPAEFTRKVRHVIFGFLSAWVSADFEAAMAWLEDPGDDSGRPWGEKELRGVMEAYLVEHRRVSLDAEGRNLRFTLVRPAEDRSSWTVDQVLVDPDGNNDWVAVFRVRLQPSRELGRPHLQLLGVHPSSQG